MSKMIAEIAAELLRTSTAVDAGDLPPRLDLLVAAGLYGAAAPIEVGGYGHQTAAFADVIAALAGGCLTTTLVWLQHQAPLAVVSTAGQHIRDRWLRPMIIGEVHSGIAMARPDQVRVDSVPGGFRLTGESPWVTGWGMVDVLLVGGVDGNGMLHLVLVDTTTPGLIADRIELSAVNASNTVTLMLDGCFVPADRLVGVQPWPEFAASQRSGQRMNGFLAVGAAARCAHELGSDDLAADVADVRHRLLVADEQGLPDARAAAGLLAVHAATRLVVDTGSRSVVADQSAGRMLREAGFLLVFGSRPTIKQRMLERLVA